jgi:predicted nucleic acid-binding protein
MAKTLVEVDEEQLAAAQKVLKTETKKDTVNAALRQVTALAARRRDLQAHLLRAARPDRRRGNARRMAAVATHVANTSALAVGFPDLLIAAVAEREQVTLLHYNGDYDVIAEVTGQPMQWVVPRGTVP